MSNQILQAIPNLVTRSLICVDRIESSDISGMLYNPYLPNPMEYQNIMDVIRILEEFFNDISYPQSYFEDRSFLGDKSGQDLKEPVAVHRYMDNAVFEAHSGQIATFEIFVKYRQSASWQGDFCWKETGTRSFFRSTLELIKLIDGCLGEVDGSYRANP